MSSYDLSNPPAGLPQVDAATAYRQLQAGEISILDVREPYEWEQGHVDGATHIPLDQLAGRAGELDPAARWVCVCRGGIRSSYAAALLKSRGMDATNLEGGMLAWDSRQLPITAPGLVAPH